MFGGRSGKGSFELIAWAIADAHRPVKCHVHLGHPFVLLFFRLVPLDSQRPYLMHHRASCASHAAGDTAKAVTQVCELTCSNYARRQQTSVESMWRSFQRPLVHLLITYLPNSNNLLRA